MTVSFSAWAIEVIGRAADAARRLNPDARVRLERADGSLVATLTDAPAPGDDRATAGEVEVFVSAGLEGLVDVEPPHDRLVLRAAGSTPTPRD